MIDLMHTGGARIPTTIHEAAEFAAECRIACIQRKLAGMELTALEDKEMEGFEALREAMFALHTVKTHTDGMPKGATNTEPLRQALEIVARLAEDQIKARFAGGWKE